MKKTSKITRRAFNKATAVTGLGVALTPLSVLSDNKSNISVGENEYDYIVVGSGAGGGPLAANLAKHGFSVLVLEAGSKDVKSDNYRIPAYHAFSSEDKNLSWHYFVKHYSGNLDKLDSKYVPGKGIFYPRGATIGGSTAVNAMITVYPHADDFDYIAKLTGDASWGASTMRKYLAYVEQCEYLNYFQAKQQKHGVNGWLPTNYFKFDLITLLENAILAGIIKANLDHHNSSLTEFLVNKNKFDVNNLYFHQGGTGAVSIPQTMNSKSVRHSVREYLLDTQKRHPNKLIIKTDALVSKVVFDSDNKAIGVEYLEGKNTYSADPLYASGNPYKTKIVKAKKEIILSAGAFNTPQILQLSGVGNKELLNSKGIPVVKHLPGVGKNLQDRYELGVTYELTGNIAQSCKFGNGYDYCLDLFNLFGKGAYTSSGSIAANIFKSNKALKNPDIFNFCLLSNFKGYYPNYSDAIKTNENKITWAILKGHTTNTLGEVKIKDKSPRNTPHINFKYFDDAKDFEGQDMKALIKGVNNVRAIMNNKYVKPFVKQEVWPGEKVVTDKDLKRFISKETWGHHASCSCKIGADTDENAVLDSNFKVKGVTNLRVVDASVFPKIPGFFLAVPIYLISEKATDVILEEAGIKRSKNIFYSTVSGFTKKREADLKNKIDVKPYPNPFVTNLQLQLKHPNPPQTIEISIFNTVNQVVYVKKIPYNDTVTLDLKHLSSGAYKYIIKFGDVIKHGKILRR